MIAPFAGHDIQVAEDGAVHVSGVDAATVGTIAFAAGVEVHELRTERADLEGVFLELTQGKAGIR